MIKFITKIGMIEILGAGYSLGKAVERLPNEHA
jgi:hypothetical protein